MAARLPETKTLPTESLTPQAPNILLESVRNTRDQRTASLPLNSALALEQAGPAAAKSSSLDKYYSKAKQESGSGQVKTHGDTFFQRLSNLRRSFTPGERGGRGGPGWERGGRSGPAVRPHCPGTSAPFFHGCRAAEGAVRRGEGRERRAGLHSALLTTPRPLPGYRPPSRNYQWQRLVPVQTKRQAGYGCLRRSFSFSDGQVIAQAVVDGDAKVMSELYSKFPCSDDSVYTVIDRAKSDKRRKQNPLESNKLSQNRPEVKAVEVVAGPGEEADQTGKAADIKLEPVAGRERPQTRTRYCCSLL